MEIIQPNNPKVDAVIARIKKLPPLPDNIQQINRMIDDDRATLDAVARELAKDQSLSAQVLQLVNSSFYGFSETVTSISQAVIMLGLNVIRSLVSTSWVAGMMEKSSAGFYDHSLATARACYVLSRSLGIDEPEELSAIGLLHDIGKVITAEHLSEDFNTITKYVQNNNTRFFEAEREVLGIDHADLGGCLLKKWNLPPNAVIPIQYHHTDGLPEEFIERTAILKLANCIVRAEGIGFAGDERMPDLSQETTEVLDVAVEDLEDLANEVADQLRDIPRYKGEIAA